MRDKKRDAYTSVEKAYRSGKIGRMKQKADSIETNIDFSKVDRFKKEWDALKSMESEVREYMLLGKEKNNPNDKQLQQALDLTLDVNSSIKKKKQQFRESVHKELCISKSVIDWYEGLAVINEEEILSKERDMIRTLQEFARVVQRGDYESVVGDIVRRYDCLIAQIDEEYHLGDSHNVMIEKSGNNEVFLKTIFSREKSGKYQEVNPEEYKLLHTIDKRLGNSFKNFSSDDELTLEKRLLLSDYELLKLKRQEEAAEIGKKYISGVIMYTDRSLREVVKEYGLMGLSENISWKVNEPTKASCIIANKDKQLFLDIRKEYLDTSKTKDVSVIRSGKNKVFKRFLRNPEQDYAFSDFEAVVDNYNAQDDKTTSKVDNIIGQFSY